MDNGERIKFNNILISMIEAGQFEDFMCYFNERYESGEFEKFIFSLERIFDLYLDRDEAIAISVLKAENNKMLMNSK